MQFVIDDSSGVNKVRLDITDVKIEKKETLLPYLIFNASTYNVIKSYTKEPEGFDHIFRGVNFVLDHLDNSSKCEVAKFFAHANYCVRDTLQKYKEKPREMAGRSIATFVGELGEQYLAMVR